MNREQLQNNFRELKVKIKEKWGKLSEDEITQINGNFEQLLAKLQQKYGFNREKAEEELRNWNFLQALPVLVEELSNQKHNLKAEKKLKHASN